MRDTSFQAITSNSIASIKVDLNNIDIISVPLQIGNAFTNYFQLINDPTGFPNRVDSIIDINNATRTFSISPINTSFNTYYKGNELSVLTNIKQVIDDISIDYDKYVNGNGDSLENAINSFTYPFVTQLFKDTCLDMIVYNWN